MYLGFSEHIRPGFWHLIAPQVEETQRKNSHPGSSKNTQALLKDSAEPSKKRRGVVCEYTWIITGLLKLPSNTGNYNKVIEEEGCLKH